MKMRPILFSTAMVQAILEGRKTQTRRVVKPKHLPIEIAPNDFLISLDVCPYGQPGDILWVRETWALPQDLDGNDIGYQYKTEYGDGSEDWNWRPSIHMPFAAARIFLRIKAVRAERLQQISEEDSIHEGIGRFTKDEAVYKHGLDGWEWVSMERKPSDAFRTLWQTINGPESWNANPWVWVVEFERISREEVQP